MADDYIWLGGRPVAIVRGNLTSAWAHQADNTGTCTRNGDPANCRIYFPVTDVIGKAVLMLNAAGHVAGTGEYDPFGHVNRVFIDAETAHPYNTADASAFADFTQAVGSGMKVDMRVFVDSLDLDGVSASDGCPVASGSGDALRILDGASNAVLTTLSQSGGLLASAWVAPTAGRIKLALSGPGGCGLSPACAPCDPITGICPDCPPGTCTMTCDGVSTSTSATGVVAGSYEYRRYETGQAPFWTPLRFPGQYYDAESDLAENWNRYYSQSLGIYNSADPVLQESESIKAAASNGRSAIAYVYASNNAVRFADADGFKITSTTDQGPDQTDPSQRDDGQTHVEARYVESPCKCVDGTFKFDINVSIRMWRSFISDIAKDDESCDTAGTTLSGHEDLHVADLRDEFANQSLDSAYQTEGFSGLEACQAARRLFDDWFANYERHARDVTGRRRDDPRCRRKR